MILAIDIGNTLCKIAVFNEQNTIADKFTSELSPDFISDICNKYPETKKYFSTVKNITPEINKVFQDRNIINISNFKNIPVKIKYETPQTLGQDRLAAICGAKYFSNQANEALLVIQMGTAITFDIVNTENEYIGGAISPGLNLRFLSLHNFTDRLPLMKKTLSFDLYGKNTDTSIINGVMNGFTSEIDNYIDQFHAIHENGKVYITGGDAAYFANNKKKSIFAIENLVLHGINFLYNTNK